jgi:ABC-2 type transport system permease protein
VRVLRLAAGRVRWEQKMYWRNPAAAGFTFAFPLMFLVIFTAINGNNRVHITGGYVHFSQFFVPTIVGFGIISACYTNLAITITFRREQGILKRTRGTPLPPLAYLGGLVGNAIAIALILAALTTALGLLAYGITFPPHVLGLVVTIAAAAFCFSSLGIAVSTFVPNEDAAPAVVNFAVFPLLFISGTFEPIKSGSALDQIARIFPVQHLNRLMSESIFNPYTSGTGLIARHLGMLVLWGAIGLLISLRRFRWESRRS